MAIFMVNGSWLTSEERANEIGVHTRFVSLLIFDGPFPLTPALSLGEREQLLDALDSLLAFAVISASSNSEDPDSGANFKAYKNPGSANSSPSPKGEGRGEGEERKRKQ
jgi:hypothetical protein